MAGVEPFFDGEGVTIYHGDCRGVVLSGDLAIYDPPYNVGVDYGDGPEADRLPPDEYRARLVEVLSGLDAPTLAWTPGVVNVELALQVLHDTPWRFVRMLGWHKREFAGDKWNGGPAISWEPIVWATREDKPFYVKKFGVWGRDFLVVPSTHGHGIKHPCPKPPEVYRWLIGLLCPEGGTVIDPTCGSGTSLMEAKNSGRKGIGVDTNADYCLMATRRCAQGVLALDTRP